MTNAEARFNIALRPRNPSGSLDGKSRTATSAWTQLLNSELSKFVNGMINV